MLLVLEPFSGSKRRLVRR